MSNVFQILHVPHLHGCGPFPFYALNIHNCAIAYEISPIFKLDPLVVIPHRIKHRADTFLANCDPCTTVNFEDTPESLGRATQDPPVKVTLAIIEALDVNRAVVVLGGKGLVCGFLPALISILKGRHGQIEKVISSILTMGYRLSPYQIIYLQGLSDSMLLTSEIGIAGAGTDHRTQ